MTATLAPGSAWQCIACGKIANSAARPRHHVRNGAQCGPFVAAQIAPDGAVLVPAAAVAQPEPGLRYRVTTLRRYATECPRSTIMASSLTTGGIGTSGHRGSLLHAAIAEILRTLWRANEPRFERTEEAVVILRETAAHGPWVVTPADMFGVRNLDGTTAESGLVQMISSFAQEPWKPSRFLIIEGAAAPFAGEARMTMEIACPDGEIRTLSGAPDLIIADPPNGAIIIDHKQSMARPTQPRDPVPEGQPIRGLQYFTDPQGDYFQLSSYAALAMHAYPAIKTVTLREMNWRWMGPAREVTITRELVEEHAIPYLAAVMMQYDQGLREGKASVFAQPRAGKQCDTRCSVKASCPIAAEERGIGAIDSEAAADALAQRWRVIKALEPDMRKAIKHWHEATGHCPDAGSGQVARWKGERGDRKFGFHAPVDDAPAVDGAATDDGFIAQWEAELERRTTAAA